MQTVRLGYSGLLILFLLIVPFSLPVRTAGVTDSFEAVRLLQQASFGATTDELNQVQAIGIEAWTDMQLSFDTPPKHLALTQHIAALAEPEQQWHSPEGIYNAEGLNRLAGYQSSAWWQQALSAPDQLRQRVAFALSQLLVVSDSEPPLHRRGEALAAYYDLLVAHAFGNYRELLSAISLSPAMGIYLSHQGNRRADPKKNTFPDENFARELMQLFIIGLYQLKPDGTPAADSRDQPIPSYTQADVMALARVFTGWDLAANKRFGGKGARRGDYLKPMEPTETFHDSGSKQLLGQTIPEGQNAREDMNSALDILFHHPNTGPFVVKHLIQRLVSSNPTPAYVQRVAGVFADNGQGKRGDLKAVVRAILLDAEARTTALNGGKLKEPILALTNILRYLEAQPVDGWFAPTGGQMHGVFWINRVNIGQNPMRSPSVFNFFSSDFVPADSRFQDNGWVAPEYELMTPEVLIAFSNIIERLINQREEQHILARYSDWQTYLDALHPGFPVLSITITPHLQRLERVLDGDSDGHQRRLAILSLLEQLESDLLTAPMGLDYQNRLLTYLEQPQHKNAPAKEARRIIRDSLRLITTTAPFWVQR